MRNPNPKLPPQNLCIVSLLNTILLSHWISGINASIKSTKLNLSLYIRALSLTLASPRVEKIHIVPK